MSIRLLPTVGVSDQRLGASFSHLLTAVVCDQRVGVSFRLLPTAGVSDQRLGASFSHLLTAVVCDQRVGVSFRLFPTAGVCVMHHLDSCPPQV